MASAAATREDFVAGNLPAICVKSGVETQRFTSVRITSAPGWTWILILFGILPFLIVRYLVAKSAAGRVPVTEAVGRRVRTIEWALIAAVLVGIVLILIGFVGGSYLAIGGLVVAVVALVILEGARGTWWISGRVSGNDVWLHGVHANFAHALGAQYHDRPDEAPGPPR
ncbi:MAG TPA: hypothetical protein VNN79_00810 [Actinomycetota bacterium]|nr:hypothetical protein [Actinomycetota bacterium]